MSISTFNRARQVLNAFTRPRKLPPRPEDEHALVGATRHAIQHLGAELVAWSWGTGSPVLLLHGWESRASHMVDFVPPLVCAGYRAMALDAPAHGDSQGNILDVVG